MAAEEHTEEIHLKHLLPFVGRELPRLLVRARDAGVVHEDVHAAECVEGRVSGGHHGVGLRQVHDRGVNGPRSGERFRGRTERLDIAVPQAARRAGGEEALRDGEANAARAAGDDGVLSLKIDFVHELRMDC